MEPIGSRFSEDSGKEWSLKKLRLRMERVYQKEMFWPGVIGLFINPFYFARKGLAVRMAELGPQITGRTLDIGCGLRPYQHFCRSAEYIGLELDSEQHRKAKRADCYYDGRRIPFSDAEFDSVISSQVLEHVFNPDEFLSEIHRVLKPGGKILLTVPFLWDEHEAPFDYGRYTSYGLLFLFKKHGFEVLQSTKTMGDIRAVFQVFAMFLERTLRTRSPYINLSLRVLMMSPLNIAGELLWRITPRNEAFYLDNVVLGRR
jgi:SAM-dependent methyltransferase